MCSCPRERDDPARRPRRVLRVGRAARRPAAARPAGDRRRRAWCSPRATRRRRAGFAPRWAARRPAACAPTRSSCRPACRRLHRGEQGGVRGVRRHDARSSRGSRSTRRSSTWAGCGASRARPLEIAARLRRDVRDEVGLPITVGVARTKFLAKVASGVAKPDGLLVVEPERELEFLHPLPVERLWGVGPVTARRSSTHRGVTTVGQVAAGDAVARRDARPRSRPAPARARAQPRSAPVEAGRRRRSIGAQRALGRRRRVRAEIDAALVGARRPRRRGGCAAAHRVGRTVVLRLRFDDFARATRSHTLAQATADTAAILAPPRALLVRGRGRRSSGAASRSSASRSRTSTTTTRCSSRCRSTAPDTGPLDAALDEVRDRFGSGGRDPRRAARPRPGHRDADAARLTRRLAPGDARRRSRVGDG